MKQKPNGKVSNQVNDLRSQCLVLKRIYLYEEGSILLLLQKQHHDSSTIPAETVSKN